MNEEPPYTQCFSLFNESSVPVTFQNQTTAEKWAGVHIYQEMTSIIKSLLEEKNQSKSR